MFALGHEMLGSTGALPTQPLVWVSTPLGIVIVLTVLAAVCGLLWFLVGLKRFSTHRRMVRPPKKAARLGGAWPRPRGSEA